MTLKDDFTNLERKTDDLEKSFAMEILQDYKLANKRQFIIIMALIAVVLCLFGHIIYLYEDIGTVETTQEISDFDSIEGNVINGGDIYGENKTNN